MGIEVTPQFIMEYERRMRVNQERQYAKLVLAKNYWANKVLRPLKIEGRTERVTWLLETAMIRPIGPSGAGGMTFQNLVSATVEYTSFKHGHGIRVQRDQLEDLDGDGLNQLIGWATQVGQQIGYYPQKLLAQLILNGANTDGSANAYDGLPFFMDNTVGTGNASPDNDYSNGHYYNPYNSVVGGYYNWLHGAAITASAGNHQSYPGALPIDDTVSVETALINLGKAIAYLATVKQANGQDPRFLQPAYLIAPPRMAPRVNQLMQAKFIAQAGASGTGTGDVMATIEGFGLGKQVIAPELGANFTYTTQMPFVPSGTTGTGGQPQFLQETLTGSDTTYYLVTEDAAETALGALLHVQRDPFRVRYFGEGGSSTMDAQISRMDEFEYQCKGRMSCQYGHPFGIVRIDST
jgi:hypothetical protein